MMLVMEPTTWVVKDIGIIRWGDNSWY